MKENARSFTGIEIGRLIFACFIPLLHIGFEWQGMFFVQQYLARLGVPFFFVVSGMFLAKSIEKKGAYQAWANYTKHIGRMLLIWLAIYMPVICMQEGGVPLREILFRTPAFLWYLTALLIAAVPFCFIRSRKGLFIAAMILYCAGTLFGSTYQWLTGGIPYYDNIFLTTRNGLFFGLPLMCIGEFSWKKNNISIIVLIATIVLYASEVTVVSMFIEPGVDRSMYLTLPAVMFCIIVALRGWNPDINTNDFGKLSTAIYMMQFGVITVVTKMVTVALSLSGDALSFIVYAMVLIVPCVAYRVFKNTKIVKYLL